MDKELIEKISDLVIKKIIERSRSVIAIYTGSPRGLEDAQKQLSAMRQHGYKFTVYATRSARSILNMDAIMRDLGARQSGFIEDYHKLLPLGSAIAVPTMTRNAAAKLALGISDESYLDIIAQGMMRGYKVAAAVDGCCPGRIIDRAVTGIDGYKKMLAGHLETLESYGIRLCAANELGAAVEEICALTTKKRPPMSAELTDRRIISMADAAGIPDGATMTVAGDAVITPLLKDHLRDHNIKIERR